MFLYQQRTVADLPTVSTELFLSFRSYIRTINVVWYSLIADAFGIIVYCINIKLVASGTGVIELFGITRMQLIRKRFYNL